MRVTHGTGYRYSTEGRSAHEKAPASGAAALWSANGAEWPVSGDMSLVEHGTRGMRNAGLPLWSMPGVKAAPYVLDYTRALELVHELEDAAKARA